MHNVGLTHHVGTFFAEKSYQNGSCGWWSHGLNEAKSQNHETGPCFKYGPNAHPFLIPQQLHIVGEGFVDGSHVIIDRWYTEGNAGSNNDHEWQGPDSAVYPKRWKMVELIKLSCQLSLPCGFMLACMDEAMMDLWIKHCHSTWKSIIPSHIVNSSHIGLIMWSYHGAYWYKNPIAENKVQHIPGGCIYLCQSVNIVVNQPTQYRNMQEYEKEGFWMEDLIL